MCTLQEIKKEVNNAKTYEDFREVRFLWNQFCEENDLEVDTYLYDQTFFDIWFEYMMYNSGSTPMFNTYDDFYEFMCMDLV